MDNSVGPIAADVFVYATGQDNRTFALLQRLNEQLVLKTDNVLLNDQLTPTGRQVEAGSGFVPRDAGHSINFITDDRTALAVHIVQNTRHWRINETLKT